MALDFRRFMGYSPDELEELLPYLYKDAKFSVVTFRRNEIKTVYVSKNLDCKWIGIEYWDGDVVKTDGESVENCTIHELYKSLV